MPTLTELGVPDFAVTRWFGLVAPSDMPDAVVNQLAQAIRGALAEETIRRRYKEIGFATQASTPDVFTEKVRAEEVRWSGSLMSAD